MIQTNLRSQVLAILLSLVLCVSFAFAQKPTPTPERSHEIVALLNDARYAAPELTVDVLLKVIESKKIADPAWRREILDETFRTADEVKYPVRRERAYHGTGIVDTVSGYMTYAYEQNLDALSLKARIVKAWLREDKARARQMVFQIGGDLNLKPLICADAMGYEVTGIYASVGAVGKDAFSSSEIKDGLRGLFLLPWIENMQSPAQILPAIEMIKGLRSLPAERQMLINAFTRSISRNFGDDLSFSHAFYRNSYVASQFIAESDDSEGLVVAWRELLVKNTSGKRCLESKPKNREDLPHPVMHFNRLFPEDKRFSVEDFASVEYRGTPKDKLYLDSEMNKKLLRLLRSAREKKNLPENKDDKAAQLEWHLRVTEMLDLLDSWKASPEETEAEVFNQKAVFYDTIARDVTESEQNKAVSRAFMRFLDRSPVQKESFIEWLYYLRRFIGKNPRAFIELVPEFPNPNFKMIVAMKKLGL